MSSWTYSILENYCTYGWNSKKLHRYINNTGEISVVKNKNYIPIANRPKWCVRHNHKMVPCLRCMEDNKVGKCKFFAYCEADKKEYKVLEKGMNDEYNNKLFKSVSRNK